MKNRSKSLSISGSIFGTLQTAIATFDLRQQALQTPPQEHLKVTKLDHRTVVHFEGPGTWNRD